MYPLESLRNRNNFNKQIRKTIILLNLKLNPLGIQNVCQVVYITLLNYKYTILLFTIKMKQSLCRRFVSALYTFRTTKEYFNKPEIISICVASGTWRIFMQVPLRKLRR